MRPDDTDVDSRLIATQNLPVASSFVDHSGKLTAMTFVGHDLVALAGDDHRIRLWPNDGARGSREAVAAIADPADRTVTLLSAGNLLLSAGSDNRVRIWDVADPAHPVSRQTLDTGDAIATATLTRDGHFLAVVHQHEVILWDITDPSAPRALPGRLPLDGMPYGAIFLGDSRGLLIAVNRIQGGFGTVKSILSTNIDPVQGISSPTTVQQGSAGLGVVPVGPERMVLVADNQGQASTGGTLGSTVRFARVEQSGTLTRVGSAFTVAAADALIGATATPDGSVLATVTVEGTTLWNLADLSQPTVLGTQLAGASARCAGAGQGCSASPVFSGFDPDGKEFVAGLSNGTVQRWSLPHSVLAGQSGPIEALSNGLSSDGRRMITLAPGTDAHIWDIENPADVRLLGAIPRPDTELAGISATAVPAISADGRYVALLLHGVMTLLDITDPAKPHEVAHFPGAAGAAFAADRPLMATLVALPTPEMLFWDISDPAAPARIGGPVLIPVSRQLMSDGLQLAQTRDGQLVVSLTDKLQVWKAFVQSDSRTPIGSADAARDSGAAGLAVSPDHRTAVTGWNSGTVQLWNIADPARITALGDPLPVSSITVDSVDFSADGTRLATGGTDSTVRLWDTSDPAHPKALGQSITESSSPGWRVAFHPKANFLVGAGDNGVLRVWDLDAEHAVSRVCALTRETVAAQLAAALPGHTLPAVCA
ncbi:WD40 repeat domain-containing protein [Nocardia sp. NPDC059240]|uniref:WD40 repeat domain-containing protein n=1 Tax=Nocardia sp. NPDC059240 TaxID=3346786 RepID=UPI0036B7ABBC